MQIRNHKIVCFLLAMIVSLSGMCFTCSQADISFLYAPADARGSTVKPADAAIREPQLCTNETLGVRSQADMQQLANRIISQKKGVFSPVVLLSLYSASSSSGKFYTGFVMKQAYHPYRDVLVADYIHRSDGKKRV